MENSEILKVVRYHNIQAGHPDCPCVLRANGKLEAHDQSRMPQSDEELEQWKVEYDNRIDLTGQKATCIQNLKDTDYMLLSDFEYSEDLPDLLIKRAEWKRIIKSDKLEDIPPKPFS